MKNSITVFATCASLAFAYSCAAQQEPGADAGSPDANSASPIELGRIDWERDFDTAQRRATASHKPLLLLFQEVPG
jgi:hypothetical protein